MNPFDVFKYCPKCGSIHFVENDFKSKKCKDCGFVYYFNSAASTAAFIVGKDGKLLVARRAKEPAKGTLDLPGGFVDMRETAEEAIIREVKEETGLVISSPQYLFSLPNIYIFSKLEVHTLDIYYKCEIEDITGICAGDDVSELCFLDKKDINPDEFGLTSIRQAIKYWLSI